MNNFQFKTSLTFVTLIFLVFLIECIYFFPSPTGDDVWFLNTSFYICRENLFISTGHPGYSIKWLDHGWFMPYILAKFNFYCSLRGIFIFNFLLKIITSYVIYLLLEKKELNKFYLLLSILLVFLIQLKLQFRPETFSILIYLLILLNFQNKNYIISGTLFAILFYTHPTIFCFTGLFILIYFYREIPKNFFKLTITFLVFIALLNLIFPYTIFDYINGFMNNSSTWIDAPKDPYFDDLVEFYLMTKFIPLWGLLFFIIYGFLIYNYPLMSLTIPFILFFGPKVPMSNYVLLGLTPFVLVLLYEKFRIINFHKNTFFKKYIFILTLIVIVLGFSQYLSRNLFTIYFHGNELLKTKNFIKKNINEIYKFPTYSFTINKDVKFIPYHKTDNNCLGCNANVKIPKYSLWSVNGRRNPCPKKSILLKDHSIKLLNKTIYKGNAGYGVWICKLDSN